VALLTPATAVAADLDAEARERSWTWVQGWIADPAVVAPIEQQNATRGRLSEEEVLALDQRWREELKRDPGQRPLINEVLASSLSSYLRERTAQGDGLVREVFVMDARGLLVGTNRITSDYWQGDEDKWRRVMRDGADAHVEPVAKDESTQTYLMHVSFPVFAPGTTRRIGVICVGVNVERLRKPAGR
jgi:hypothetical protein